MQLQLGICKGCDNELPIENRRHMMCSECNYKRLHDGRTKNEVYRDRVDSRARSVRSNETRKSNSSSSITNGGVVKKASSIAAVSSEKRYKCSNGQLVSQVDIKRRLAEVYDEIKGTREAVCQGSGRWDLPLSMSHTISQARCKELGKSELIWDLSNIEVESFEAPTSRPTYAHNIWECGTTELKMTLLNFDRKLAYIKIHDLEEYNRWMVKIEQVKRRIKQ